MGRWFCAILDGKKPEKQLFFRKYYYLTNKLWRVSIKCKLFEGDFMKKICLVLAILCIPALLFAAGSSQQPASGAGGGEISFAWWGNATRDAQTNDIVDLFIQKNPGVNVETEAPNWAGYWTRMNTLAAAQNLPDVMQQDVSYIKLYAARNQLEALDSYISSNTINVPAAERPSHAHGNLDGRQYGLILGTNAWGMLVNLDILQQAGVTINDATWTWADYERIATQIYQRTGVQSICFVAFVQMQEHISRQYGSARFTTDDRQIGIGTNRQARDAFRDYVAMEARLRQAGVNYDPEDGFIQGRAMAEEPMARGLTWNGGGWSNQYIGHQNANQTGARYGYYMLPTVSGSRAPFGLYYRASMFISMLASSQNKNLSARFIDFFMNDIEAGRIRTTERGVPSPAAIRNDIYPRIDAQNQFIMDYITRIGPFTSPADPPYPAAAGELETTHRALMQRAVMGQITPDFAVDEMIRTAAEVLGRQ
jgi:multiple sugar transport system substrate-binding protein